MTPSLVSCIIPVYNGERFLGETLASALAQTYQPLEVIVVDDGSTDATRTVVAQFGERVRYIWQPNRGATTARNVGIAAAHGEFISFLDADDLWHPEKSARQLARMADATLDVSVAQIQNFWMDEVRAEGERSKKHPRAQPIPGYHVNTMVVRRRVLDHLGAFDPQWKHSADTEWFVRAELRAVRVELVPEVLVYRRLHLHNVSRKEANESQQEYLRLFRHYRTHLRGRTFAASNAEPRE